MLTLQPDGNGGYIPAGGPGNSAPVTIYASVSTTENTPVAVTVQGTDADNDPLTYALAAGPANGTITGTAPNFTYTPANGWSGADSFQFSVNDGQQTAVGTVTVQVTPRANTAPVPDAIDVTTTAGTAVNITLTATDAEGDPLTFAVTSSPSLGTLTGAAPNLTCTPAANQSGPDSFQFSVSDGRATSVGSATITIQAAPPTGPGVTIDGDFSDWTAIASVGAGRIVPDSAGNQIDLTALKLAHDDTHIQVLYANENTVTLGWGFTLYLNTDRSAQSGFAMWDIGADYMVQGANVYRYTGSGTDWSWAFVETAANAELAITRAGLGNPDSINYLFYGENAAFGGNEIEIVPAFALTGGAGHLRYDLTVAAPGGNVIDGNLADWARPALATDGDDVTGTANPLDIRELRFANDANNFHLAAVNEGPLTLNWGFTLYLDTDATAITGFGYWSVGADYMVQGANLYRYTGTGADWSWAWVGSIGAVVNGGTLEASFPRAYLDATAPTINLILHADNSAFGGGAVDTVPDNPAIPLSYTVQ